jgi:hypothetical protein
MLASMRVSQALLAVVFAAGLADAAAAQPRLDPGMPAGTRNAQSNQNIIMGVGLVGAAGLVIAGVLIFTPSGASAPAVQTTNTSP